MSPEPVDSTPVTKDLDQKGIPYRFFQHPGPVHSLEQAAAERGQRPSQIIRSILFRITEDTFAMVLVAGPEQISWPKLRAYLGTSRMTMANPDEVMKLTGYQPGSVSPFGLSSTIRILVDNSVCKEEEISIGSGVRNTTIIMGRDDLLRALEMIGPLEQADFLLDPVESKE